jgi:hypothetical protein
MATNCWCRGLMRCYCFSGQVTGWNNPIPVSVLVFPVPPCRHRLSTQVIGWAAQVKSTEISKQFSVVLHLINKDLITCLVQLITRIEAVQVNGNIFDVPTRYSQHYMSRSIRLLHILHASLKYVFASIVPCWQV